MHVTIGRIVMRYGAHNIRQLAILAGKMHRYCKMIRLAAHDANQAVPHVSCIYLFAHGSS